MPSALDYLGITPPGNPLSNFFPQAGGGGDDAFRARLEERPSGAGAIPQEYQIAGMLPDPSGFMQQVQKIRGDLQTQKAIKGLENLDFGSKDYSPSVARLISKHPLAAQNPAFLNILKMKEFSGQQAKDRNYDSAAAGAIKDFLSISEDDPNYDQKYQDYIKALDPEVLSHPKIAPFIERGMHNSSTLRAKKSADQQARTALDKEARRWGVSPNEYKDAEDLNDAIAERSGQALKQKDVMDYLRTDKDTAKEFSKVMSAMRAPTSGEAWDQELIDALGKKPTKGMFGGMHEPTLSEAERQSARPLALQLRQAKAREIAHFIETQTGVNPLARFEEAKAPVAQSQLTDDSEGVVPVPAVTPPVITPQGQQPLPTDPSQFPPMGVVEQNNLVEQNKNINESNTARGLTDKAWTEAKGKIGDLIETKWPDPKERLSKLISIYQASKGLTGLTGLKLLHGVAPELELAPEYKDMSVKYPEELGKMRHNSLDDTAASLGRILPGTGSPREVLYAHAADELAKAGYLDAKGNLIDPSLRRSLKSGETLPLPGGITIKKH